ncbi:MAG: FkbM family methyltransferase [Cyclobacteriaceae bacterium]|nr:FkbM family methyltransferase [Cyclobacteriaceae bacterium]
MNKRQRQQMKRWIKGWLINLGLWGRVQKWRGKETPGLAIEPLVRTGLSFYKEFVQPGSTVFDVGANYGNRVEIFLKCGAKVIAIEPQVKCGEYLKRHFGDQITWVPKGVGAKVEMREFFEADNSVLSTFSSDYIDRVKDTRHVSSLWKKSSRQVELTTLDQLLYTYGEPSFIKVDVEGFELEVVGGLTRAVGTISLEYTVPELLPDLIQIIDRLESIGYNQFNHSVGESMVFGGLWVDSHVFRERVQSHEFSGTRFGDIYARVANS